MDIQIFAGDNPDMKRYNDIILQAGAHYNYAEMNISFAMQFKREPKYNGNVVTSSVAAAAKDWNVAPQKHVHMADVLPNEKLEHALSIGLNIAKKIGGGLSMKQDGVAIVIDKDNVKGISENLEQRGNILEKMRQYLDGTRSQTQIYVPPSKKYRIGRNLI